LNGGLAGLKSWSRRFGKRHYFLIRVRNIEPLFLGFAGRTLVAIPTDLRVGRRSLKNENSVLSNVP
jgi:hypothetical protein